jgi:sortase A
MSEKPPASHEKVSHWDRPKPPHDWRWVIGGIGRTLIVLGLLMFAFVAYQLWGTGIQTAQAQRTLAREFDELIANADPTTTDATTTAPTTSPATTEAPTPDTSLPAAPTTTAAPGLPAAQPIPGAEEAVARLEIPRIGVNRIVVEGATAEALTKGPGHFPETPLPGQLGNAAIAGHRTTHLHPFFDIDELQPGDEIIVTTLNGRYVYHVTGTEIVAPDDYAAVIPTTDVTKATLTLVSCTPRYSAKNRIVVRSELVPDESDPLTAAAPVVAGAIPDDSAITLPDEGPVTVVDTVSPTVTTPAADSTSTETADTVAASSPAPSSPAPSSPASPTVATPDAFTDGWFSDTSAIPPSILWGLVLAAVAYGSYWLSHKVRRYWVGVLSGFVPFTVVLYFFYENINRLLPPNL